MLFDLQSGRRRNFIRVIYGMLAVLMGGGLILFGIGGDVSGGLLDGLGVGGDGSSGSADFEKQIEDAEKKVQANPQNEAAQLELVRAHFLAGNQELEVDEATGAATATEESQQQFQRAADAWDQYLNLKPAQPSPEVATLMSQAYVSLAETATTGGDALTSIKGAAAAQQIVADAMPSVGSLSNLALYLYFAGDTAAAETAAKQAEKHAEASQRETLRQQLAAFKKNAAAFQKQVEEANKQAQAGAPGANPLESPAGGLSGGGLGGSSLGGP